MASLASNIISYAYNRALMTKYSSLTPLISHSSKHSLISSMKNSNRVVHSTILNDFNDNQNFFSLKNVDLALNRELQTEWCNMFMAASRSNDTLMAYNLSHMSSRSTVLKAFLKLIKAQNKVVSVLLDFSKTNTQDQNMINNVVYMAKTSLKPCIFCWGSLYVFNFDSINLPNNLEKTQFIMIVQ